MNELTTGDLFRELLTSVLHWWWVILLLAAGTFAFGQLASDSSDASFTYAAESRILVQQASPTGLVEPDLFGSVELAFLHSQLLTETNVLLAAADQLGLEAPASTLRSWVTVAIVEETPIIRIQVSHPDPEIAAAFANALARVFITMTEEQYLTRVARLQNLAGSMGIDYGEQFLIAQLTALGNLVVIRDATVPQSPQVNTIGGLRRRLLMPGAIMVGLALAVGLEFLSGKVRNPSRMKRETGVEPIGVIPRWRRREAQRREAVVLRRPESHFAEAYRQAMTRLHALWSAGQDPVKTAVVTSPGPAEGKTTTAVNTALALAETGKTVILVDADLHRPELHRWFDVRNEAGLTNVLADQSTNVRSLLRTTMMENLRVMTSGPRPPRGAQLLRTEALARVIEALLQEAEAIVFDGPPMLASSDALGLITCGDGVILVADAGRTRTSNLKKAVQQVEELNNPDGSSRMGVILNRFRPPLIAYYAYYRYYQEYKYYYGIKERMGDRPTTQGGARGAGGWWHITKVTRVKKVVFRRARGITRRHR